MNNRRSEARHVRQYAAELAFHRPHPEHANNGEEFLYRDDKNQPSYIASFTKGLPHDKHGFVLRVEGDEDPYQRFVLGIQSGDVNDFRHTPLGPPKGLHSGAHHHDGHAPSGDGGVATDEAADGDGAAAEAAADTEVAVETRTTANGKKANLIASDPVEGLTYYDSKPDPHPDLWCSQMAQKQNDGQGAAVRAWESAGAGLVFDLQGPDAQAVTMPPAPRLGSDELTAEVAEVYLQALLRDVPFSVMREDAPNSPERQMVDDAIALLNTLPWFDSAERANRDGDERLRSRSDFTRQTVFRGIAPGDDIGPYLSQFLLIGNKGLGSAFEAKNGRIMYGAVSISQRVRVATPERDYMTTFEQWLDVQNGADLRGIESYVDTPGQRFHFIRTPRDLSTYVHYDALYEAYLNACLLLLGMGAPFDPGIPFQVADNIDKQQGFAHFGGPHILSLVTEVATRALKAVRYQKFNVHRRARPEAMGGLVHLCKKKPGDERLYRVVKMVQDLDAAQLDGQSLLDAVKDHNAQQNTAWATTDGDCRGDDASAVEDVYLLPMAFPEGSPMHPAYGAGHATVAGACVTILKAYFDHGYVLSKPVEGEADTNGKAPGPFIAYEAGANKEELDEIQVEQPLTVEGELNKLAANISIGRNWAGVHYFTDYIESIKMGEQIALGILEEQKLTYGENFTMTVPLFNGDVVRV